MSKIMDFIMATQLSTSFAWMCAIGAHLVAVHANENWTFSVYFLLVCSLGFMLFPYLVNDGDTDVETNHNW